MSGYSLFQTTPPFMLVDGHVHFHRCFTWKPFLSSASANFERARSAFQLPRDCPGCLMFTESAGENSLQLLQRGTIDLRPHGWAMEPHDDGSIGLRRGAETLLIVPGRQVITNERIEVLALGCPDVILDTRPLLEVLRSIAARGAIAVLPWGFGKWLGRRGRILRTLIEDGAGVPFCLGDNGGRAKQLPRPSLLTLASRRGIPVLCGSDPLPMPAQVTRPGSYGFILTGVPTGRRPAASILEAIRGMRTSPPAFGDLNSARVMLRTQVALRLRTLRRGVETSA